eukprot:TRINITY_DN974_c0_g1_i1.p1 TRINITY_DN974_c0_g1~~TRINITY_DN974_c0_g1_i1.p1  ORF type:complete len:264 (+),score=73.43 TRINITY_DN974_c0_g1_i1:90-881(+)
MADVKEEGGEDTKPYVSVLDTKNEDKKTWLVRVPKWLADIWDTKAENVELGRIELVEDVSDSKKNQVCLVLPPDIPGICCQKFRMNNSNINNPLKIVSEDIQGNVVIEGNVGFKFDLDPFDKKNVKAAMINTSAALNPANPKNSLPKTQVRNSVARIGSRTLPNVLTGGKRKRDERGVVEKRERTDSSQLMSMIFDCFERQEFWTIKDLNDELKQPLNYLKNILSKYCDYIKKGPHKGHYEIKSEYAPNKKPRVDDPDDEGDD